MKYRLVPVSTDLEEKLITLPSDIIVKPRDEITNCLISKGCFRDNKGRLRISRRVIARSKFDDIIKFLLSGKGKRPRGLRTLLRSVKIPERLLPHRRVNMH